MVYNNDDGGRLSGRRPTALLRKQNVEDGIRQRFDDAGYAVDPDRPRHHHQHQQQLQ
jgi:hypothetical protein